MKEQILKEIKACSIPGTRPNGVNYSGLSVHDTACLSNIFNLIPRELEIIALENDIIPERYIRNIDTFSCGDQIKVLNSKVSIIGLGGLGGTVAENLARIGIGRLVLVDFDSFENSNLNRQSLCSHDTLKTYKVHAAQEKVNQINPSVTVEKYETLINEENVSGILNNPDVVVDCLDSIDARFIVEDASRQIPAPVVSASVSGLCGHIMTVFPEDTGISLIHGPREEAGMVRAEYSSGILAHTASFAANIQTSETIKIILKKGDLLRNEVFLFDFNQNFFHIRNLQPDV